MEDFAPTGGASQVRKSQAGQMSETVPVTLMDVREKIGAKQIFGLLTLSAFDDLLAESGGQWRK
jgi:hypothetical protein